MTTQTNVEPMQTVPPEEDTSTIQQGEDPWKTHLTLDGSEGRGSPTIYHQEVVEVVAEEEGVAEAVIQEIKMTEDLDQS